MLSDVLVEGSRMGWVRKVWFDLTESKTRGVIEYYSTTGNNAGAIYYVADGHASYGIDNSGDALKVFDKFGRPRPTSAEVTSVT